VSALLRELQHLRAQAGRSDLPFETILPLKQLTWPDVDTLKRLEEVGVTGILAPPLAPPLGVDGVDRERSRGIGDNSGLDDKKRTIERYAREVIQKMQ
jgi:hypothetical protein